jgi:hypothetical protein
VHCQTPTQPTGTKPPLQRQLDQFACALLRAPRLQGASGSEGSKAGCTSRPRLSLLVLNTLSQHAQQQQLDELALRQHSCRGLIGLMI